MLPTWSRARARLAWAVRDGAAPDQVAELRRTYHAARLAQRITDTLSSDFPPNAEQRCELANLLAAGGDDPDAA